LPLRTSGLKVDLSQVSHGFLQSFQAIAKFLCQLFISHQQRSKPPFWNKGMVQAENDNVVIDDMEWMAEFTGISDARSHILSGSGAGGESLQAAER